jgi:hypothetical protein
MVFVLISTILGVVGGILAMSSMLVSRKPNAAQLIDKLVPYQGYVGTTMFFWGVWELIDAVRSLGMLSSHPLIWGFWLLMAIADFSVGMILGFGLISTYAFRGNPTAIQKGQALRQALVKFQVPLGFLAILTSVGYTVLSFL